jgi:hypothetical protein
MIALNVEWLGMGQLSGPEFNHNRLNQLDLCGTSGVAPFYLLMSHALDVLLALPNADPARVAVTGLSGGGWQTIVISALDPRVTLAVPVAGYSALRTRARNPTDLGDAEQTPSDLATAGEYAAMTALLAPRPALLIYNRKDDCCFASDHALQPLLDAAAPVYELFGKRESLRAHVNDDPGTHNYEKDNREAFYKMVGDHFYAGDTKYPREEIACADEVKTKEQLDVPLPGKNVTFNQLATELMKALPRNSNLSDAERRAELKDLVHVRDWKADVHETARETFIGASVVSTRFKLGDEWTIPGVELTPAGTAKLSTAIVLSDSGRSKTSAAVLEAIREGKRVVALDVFLFGEAKPGGDRAYLLGLLAAAVGQRPLGIQAGELIAVAGRLRDTYGQPVELITDGPRTSLVALVAAAVSPELFSDIQLHGSLASLKEVIEQNHSVDEMPEMMCFGLLERFDVAQLAELAKFATPSTKRKISP